MQCVGTLSWSEIGLATAPSKSRRALQGSGEVPNAGASRLRPTGPIGSTGQTVASVVRQVRVEGNPLEVDWSQVVSLCMNGDSGAWAELVRTHHRRVYGLCYRFTGNPADAEDLTQYVFLKIYSNLASFDLTRGSLQVWITTMTRNLLVDNFRRTKNLRVTGSLDDGWESADELADLEEPFAARVGCPEGTGKDGPERSGTRLRGAARGGYSQGSAGP